MSLLHRKKGGSSAIKTSPADLADQIPRRRLVMPST
jgi:hypothetical protein